MQERHADQGHRKFWATMKEMTWKERIQHILYYYGKYMIIAVFLIYMLTDILIDAYKEKPEVLLAGTAVNVHVSVEMEKTLTEDIFSVVGGTDAEKQEVTLSPNKIDYTDVHMTSALQTKLLAGDYHYVLMDQTALDMLISMQALPNLYQVLPKEKWEPWNDRFISVQTEGVQYPVAIDISGTPLAAGCSFDGDRIYMGFPVNLDTLAVVETFLDYLLTQGLLNVP